MWKKLKPYIISVAIALAVGGLSSLLTRDNMDVYNTLNRPALAPPMWVFPVVWGILFVLMGISSAMVYIKRDKSPETAMSGLKLYAGQLIVNFFWTIIFFNLKAYLFAFIWLLVLWVLIIMTIIEFRRISHTAGWILLPYFIWVTFAGYLTLMIYLLNR